MFLLILTIKCSVLVVKNWFFINLIFFFKPRIRNEGTVNGRHGREGGTFQEFSRKSFILFYLFRRDVKFEKVPPVPPKSSISTYVHRRVPHTPQRVHLGGRDSTFSNSASLVNKSKKMKYFLGKSWKVPPSLPCLP